MTALSLKKHSTFIFVSCFFLYFCLVSSSASAAGRTLLRDAETEQMLRLLTKPVFDASSVNQEDITFALVKDNSLNAFVAGGQNIFIHTGLILATDTPDQLLGVVAHELGHINGGHLVRGTEAMKGASTQAILATIIGVGIGALSGSGDAGAAIITGGQQLATRNLLGFTRTQEASADQAALYFLDQARLSPQGFLEFMEKLEDQELLPADRQDEYVRTHPLSRNRVAAIKAYIAQEKQNYRPIPQNVMFLYDRVKHKLEGYLYPDRVLRNSVGKKDFTDAEIYGLALANYQRANIQTAISLLDQLLEKYPEDPFFHELKGQILFETGDVTEAIPFYKFASTAIPTNAGLHADYAHALLETGNDDNLDLALIELNKATKLDPNNPLAWRFLASVYGKKDQRALSLYALAAESAAKGNYRQAQSLANQALKQLPEGSPAWLQAQDIYNESQRVLKK